MTCFPYAGTIESLVYVMVSTRLDLTQIVNLESSYMINPSKEHYQDVKHIFRYLKGLRHWCQGDSQSTLGRFFNSYYIIDLDVRRFVIYYFFYDLQTSHKLESYYPTNRSFVDHKS